MDQYRRCIQASSTLQILQSQCSKFGLSIINHWCFRYIMSKWFVHPTNAYNWPMGYNWYLLYFALSFLGWRIFQNFFKVCYDLTRIVWCHWLGSPLQVWESMLYIVHDCSELWVLFCSWFVSCPLVICMLWHALIIFRWWTVMIKYVVHYHFLFISNFLFMHVKNFNCKF